jgi:hypothetical protein
MLAQPEVWVPSKGRAGRAPTIEALLADGSHVVNAVVPEGEGEAYAEEHDPRLIVWETAADGIGATREAILTSNRTLGAAGFWMVDDDITKLELRGEDLPWGDILLLMEQDAGRYPEVALAAPMHRAFAWTYDKTRIFNRRTGMFVLVKTDGPWHYWPNFHEDTDLNLQVLTQGRSTLLWPLITFDSKPMGKNLGGCYDGYRNGHAEAAGAALVNRWEHVPGLVSLRVNRRGQTVTRVDWKRFNV